MLESLKRILDKLSNFDLASWLNSITISGYKVGLDTAQKDLKEEYPSEPDMEAIVRIGMRAHALSEKAIARAKGGMAHNADKLYQEMDAAMKAGMSEKEALHQIQGRLKGLFTDSYQEWELERLVRDQFLVATKEGRRAGWQNGGMKYRQWKIHLDSKTAADSKRMEGQITEIDKPYTDPLTGEKYMLPHIRPNDRCVFYGETKVYTSKGYKQIKDVQVGDLVLTHKGRFRKVYNTYNTPRKELLYKIIYSWDGGIPYTNFISVTGEHPFMTQRGWVRAKDLTTKDKLSILSTECKECGKSIPVFRKFCSRACISRNTAKKQWEDPEHRKNISAKASIFWNKWNKENPEKRKEIVKASHKVLAEKALRGEHPLQRPESIAKNWVFRPKEETLEIREKISKAVSHDNLTNPKRISYLKSDKNLTGLWSKRGQNKSTNIEKRMEKELNKRNILFTKQYNIKRFFVDFALEEHKIAIECDGWYWHQDKEKDYQRDLQIEAEGWTILHFTDIQIKREIEKCVDEIQRVLKNHNGEYNFIPCDIKQIEVNDSKRLKKTFNLDVEEDHSFTIKGIATHNCFEVGLWELPEDTIERDGLVYTKNLEADFVKGGVGSGVKGHRTHKEEKGYLKAIKEIELFEAQVKNEPYEYGRLIDKEGKILFSTEGRNPDSIYITDQQADILHSRKGFVFSHNHPASMSFSITDIYTSIEYNTKEVRAVSKRYLYIMKFKRYISLKDFESREEVYQGIYRKLFNQYQKQYLEGKITTDEASIQMTHNVWKNFVRMYPKDFEYTREPSKKGYGDIEKGGPGSGIKGHTTVEEKKYKNILSFEDKIRNEKKENGLLCDKDGNISLMLEGTEDTVLFSASERNFLFNKAAGGIFTHNHPLGNGFSRADILSSMRAKLQEVRVVGKEYTYSIKFKKEVPANIRDEFPHRYDQVFDETYIVFMHKIFNGMSNRKAQQSCFHEMTKKISKEYSEYFTYERTKSFSKGGIGSGIKGHKTHREKNEKRRKTYKMIKNFENKIKGDSIESCLVTDEEGKVLVSKQGTKDTIRLTENERYTCREKAKKGEVIFTHNHPSSSSFSLDDILTANNFHFSESRIASKEHDYVMKLSKPLDRDEVMTSYRAQNAYYYEIFNPLVAAEKLDRNKAWMTHTHLIWKHVAEEIDGLEYKRTR